ncbi:MAG TPA: EamA family transporter RarD [Chthoniobacterales bacterium]
MSNQHSAVRKGIVCALLAYAAWGLFPIYWKAFGSVPAVEVIAHRLIWSLVFLIGVGVVTGQLRKCARIVRNPRLVGILFATATLLSVNWGIFVYGVNSKQVVETSLGYFLNPLLNVMLGAVILRERLNGAQIVAVALAAAGVCYFGWHLGHAPWIALGIATSFSLYGLLRKMAPVEALPGLIVETAVMSPVAIGILLLLAAHGSSHFADSPTHTILFVGGGVVTAVPLILFISGAKLLPFSMLGILQYLAPTLQLLVGVVLYREPFTSREVITFAFIWIAIALFVSSSRFGTSLGRRQIPNETL